MKYELSYAGIPLVSDTARIIRLPVRETAPEGTSPDRQQIPRKHQTEADLIDELNRVIPFRFLNDFSAPAEFLGRNLSTFTSLDHIKPLPDPSIPIGCWYYPTGARRWSVFRGLATSTQVKDMLAATGGSQKKAFIMKAFPDGARLSNLETSFKVQTNMYMLPPRPLAEHGAKYDGLYLITLVDDRYYLQFASATIHPDRDTTWASVISSLATALGVTINYSTIPTPYAGPEVDSQFWTNLESAAELLDAVAANIGRRVVREFDGTYTLLTPSESQSRVLTNRGSVNNLVRLAGGDVFSSGTKIMAGNLVPAANAILPTSLDVTFPFYVVNDDPVPHFLNSRYANQRPSCWYEESYGSVYTVNVPITSGGTMVSGMSGVAPAPTVRTTAKALISGEIQTAPLNQSGLTSLALQIANDYYSDKVAFVLDEVYHGTYKWTPEGLHDIVWTYSDRQRLASTRVLRSAAWNYGPEELQHQAPALSGQTSVPLGVGGPSVPQTWRDTFNVSTSTQLAATLNSGATTATFNLAGVFPQTNRWKGQIEDEKILFEGASGGTSLGIVNRAIDGTLGAAHNSGTTIRQLSYQSGGNTYGANLITAGTGLRVFPGVWTSGGVQEVRLETAGDECCIRVRFAPLVPMPAHSRSGDDFTASANGVLPAYDGITPAAGDKFLPTVEPLPEENGPMEVVDPGSTTTPARWRRVPLVNSTTGIPGGLPVYVEQGGVNGGHTYELLYPRIPAVNTDPLYFLKDPVRPEAEVATITTLPAYSKDATTGELTGTATGTLTVDGYSFTSSDVGKLLYVLNERDTNASNNGLYWLSRYGDGSQSYKLFPVPGAFRTTYIRGGTWGGTLFGPWGPSNNYVFLSGRPPVQPIAGPGGVGGNAPSNIDVAAFPIHHWTIDEGSGTTIRDRDGSLNGTAVTGAWVNDAKAPGTSYLKFTSLVLAQSAGDYISIGTSPILMGASAFTISARIRIDGATGAQQQIYSENVNAATKGAVIELLVLSDLTVQFGINLTGPGAQRAISLRKLEYNVWYHIVARFEATPASGHSGMEVYINGYKEGINSNTTNTDFTPTECYLGTAISPSTGNRAFFFNGTIQDVILF